MKPLTQNEYRQLCAICGESVSLVDRAIATAACTGMDVREERWARDSLFGKLVHDAAHAQRMEPDTVADGPAHPDMGGDYSSEEGA